MKIALMFPMPVWFHRVLGWCLEGMMQVPMVSSAQVRMLHEGLAEAAPACELMPPDLTPQIRFNSEQIRKGLPQPGPFTWRDLRCCTRQPGKLGYKHSKRAGNFFLPRVGHDDPTQPGSEATRHWRFAQAWLLGVSLTRRADARCRHYT